MLEWLFGWEVSSVVVVALAGFAFAVLAMNDFKIAKCLFLLAAADAVGGVAMWSTKNGWTMGRSVAVAFVATGMIGVLTALAFRYVDGKQKGDAKDGQLKISGTVTIENGADKVIPAPATQAPPPPPHHHVAVATPQPSGPDVSAKLVYPEQPALLLQNKSDTTARGAAALMQTWNLDRPKDKSILNIPFSTEPNGFIKNGAYMVPISLMGRPDVMSQVNPGDRIVGWMTVTCPDCVRVRAYWFYFVVGKGGWYAECQDGQYPGMNSIAKNWDVFAKNGEAALDGTVPKDSRVAITDQVP